MENALKYLESVTDTRQHKKVRHLMKDIIAIVFFALLANADSWMDIYFFALSHEEFLRKYLELENGIPSHDTIQRVFAMVSPEYLQEFRNRWNEALSDGEGEKVKRILAIDGKTQRGNGTAGRKANHIVSAVDENGLCIGERKTDEKSNEIKAIPELLDALNIKGHIITADAMGTQKEIAGKIRRKRADYVLALKGNQGTLHEDVKRYFDDPEFREKCVHARTSEKVRGGFEVREYWQTDDISWLGQKKDWAGLKSIVMARNTTAKNGVKTEETRYFISSLAPYAELAARAVRKHWMVESFHWHLDVTFHEDADHTLDRDAAYNLNIIRKLAVNILKLFDISLKNISLKNVSLRSKRFIISLHPEKQLEALMAL